MYLNICTNNDWDNLFKISRKKASSTNNVSCTGEGYILSVLNNLALESTWNLIYFIIIKKNNNDINTCKVAVGSLVSEVLGIQKELLHQPVTS